MCQNLTLKKNESVNNSHSVYFKARLQSLNKRIEQTRAHATRHRASGGTKALSLTNGLKISYFRYYLCFAFMGRVSSVGVL